MAHSATMPIAARPASSLVPWPLWVGAAAISSIIFGLYWDISWHLTIGRDTFWTPAHMAIQLGAVLAGISCGYLILRTSFGPESAARAAAVKVWGFRGPLGAFLAAWGGATMMISAPFDNWWHDSFGLDVKIVSPPHMVLATGIFFVGIGALVLMAGPKNRAEGAQQVALERMFLYIGGLLLILYLMLLIEFTDASQMHESSFYRVLCYGAPFLLMALARGSNFRWGATKAATLYTVFMIAGEWIFPLFPAEAKLGPVFTNVSHMVPLGFPLLILIPALALDWTSSRLAERNKVLLAVAAGTVFLLVTIAVQWPFANLLVSPAARNWIFGKNYFPYMRPPSTYLFSWRFQSDSSSSAFWLNMVIALVAGWVSALLGVMAGDSLRKLRR